MRGEIVIRKLATAAMSFSGAVYLAHYLLPVAAWLYAAGLCLAAALALGIFLRGDKRLRALLICLGVCAGFLSSAAGYALKNAPAAGLADFDGEVCAEITDFPREYAEYGYSSIPISIKLEDSPKISAVLYSYDYDISALTPGDIIKARVSLRPADTKAGKADKRYNAEGIYAFATLKSEPAGAGKSPWSFLHFPKHLTRKIESTALEVFSAETAPLMTALLTGNKQLLYGDEQLYVNMSAAGILHIVAVSGMHVAFLLGFVQSVLRKKRLSSVAGIMMIWLFVPVAGATPSVTRAAFMQTTALLAPLLRRENDAITALSAVLALLLLINPDACASVSLQLSFAAMLSMITITPAVYERVTSKIPRRSSYKLLSAVFGFGRGAGATLASTIGALALTTILSALYFGSFSIIGIIVNVLIFWIVSLCFVLGYAACLLGMLFLPLGQALGVLVSVPARLIIAVVNAASSVPYSSIYTGGTVFGWLIALIYVIFILCWVFRRKSGFRPALPVSLSIIALCATIIFTELQIESQKAQLTVLNVGQGQSIVAVSSAATIVIDCGGKSGEKNAGELCAAELLGMGRRSVDLLALTHTDDDHINGVTRLMSRVKVKNLILPAEAEGSGKRQKILDLAKAQGAEVYIMSDDGVCTAGDMTLSFYTPKNMNDPMLMYLWSVGEKDVLITGDAYGSQERYLIRRHTLPPVEVYVAGHHGSAHSSSKELLESLDANYAVISSGYNNYGHPAPEAISRLSAAGMEILRTDEKGNITLLME